LSIAGVIVLFPIYRPVPDLQTGDPPPDLRRYILRKRSRKVAAVRARLTRNLIHFKNFCVSSAE